MYLNPEHMGGWVKQRCHVSYVTGASNWYWLTARQGLLSLQQVRIEGECLYFFYSFIFIHYPFFPVPLFYLLYYLFYLFSPFLWETTQNDLQLSLWRVIKPQLNQSINQIVLNISYVIFYVSRKQDLTFHANGLQWRQFAWTVKCYFLNKNRTITNLSAVNLPRKWGIG